MESPSTLRITAISTTVTRTHKYTISPGLLHIAPEITVEEEHSLWVDIVRAHFKARREDDAPQDESEGNVKLFAAIHG
jgi:hypothetical protein